MNYIARNLPLALFALASNSVNAYNVTVAIDDFLIRDGGLVSIEVGVNNRGTDIIGKELAELSLYSYSQLGFDEPRLFVRPE